jgi:L-aspartate oxidase
MTTLLETDVVIVGAGMASLSAALATLGREVIIMCPASPLTAAASAFAQGGIAAASASHDTWVQHYLDTVRVGDHAVSPWAALALAKEARSAVQFLCAHGVKFDRTGDGWALSREAGHRCARVLHVAGDGTGAALLHALLQSVEARQRTQLMGNITALRLLGSPHGVVGVLGVDPAGHNVVVRARDTVLATGGLGSMFRYTTNPPHACGDGLAMALAIGAECAALEFVQFHPTALAVAADPLPLVTEALRGAGAVLINECHDRFMQAAHADGELAPRDVVARAIWAQRCAGHTVHLDATKAIGGDFAARFPTVYSLCQRFAIDPCSDPIPVTPAAHFHMGGIVVDMVGRTSVPGLWACGETAFTGAHGANRLASNSLLEAVVFGRRVGRALTGAKGHRRLLSLSRAIADSVPLAEHSSAWETLRATMWEHLGIVRTADGLRQGYRTVEALGRSVAAESGVLNQRLALAREMFQAALRRTESRGAHYRSDHPQRRSTWDGPIAAPRVCSGRTPVNRYSRSSRTLRISAPNGSDSLPRKNRP